VTKLPKTSELTAEQNIAVLHPKGPALVLSAPGSGKTLIITKRIAHLIRQGVDPKSIAAITFTNKAANSMKERTIKLVKDRRAARQVWISTFHSLCARLLRKYPTQFNVESNYTIIDDGDAKHYIEQAMLEVAKRRGETSIERLQEKYYPIETLKLLISNLKQSLVLPGEVVLTSTSQKQLFLHDTFKQYNHLLARSNTMDFDDLIVNVVRPLRDNATLRAQFATLFDHVLVDEYQDTNHAQFLLSLYLTQKTKNLFAVGDPDQCVVADSLVSTDDWSTTPAQDLKVAAKVLSAMAYQTSVISTIEQVAQRLYDGSIVVTTTTSGKQARTTLEHGFFVRTSFATPYKFTGHYFEHTAAALLQSGMIVPTLGSHGSIQEEAIDSIETVHYKGLVFDFSVPPHKNYIVNGIVVHNSIYKFRGADSTNIEAFRKLHGARIYLLQKNFRSVKNIAAIANMVIKNNRDRTLKIIDAVKDNGNPVRCLELRDNHQEAGFIAREIRGLTRIRRTNHPKDFAILYRTKAQSRIFEEIFVRMNIPHRVVGSLSFYNRAVVKDLVAYLKLLLNSKDDASFTRIYNMPPRGIGKAAFTEFCGIREAYDCSLYHVLKKRLFRKEGKFAPSSQFSLTKLRALFRRLRKLRKGPVANLVAATLKWSGYQHYFRKRGKEVDLVKLEQLDELVEAARDFDKRQTGGLEGFLEWVGLMQENDDRSEEDKVKLMTCHAAKGLEFPNVYVVGVCDGLMPFLKSTNYEQEEKTKEEQLKDIEEERRLFFVAITRAEDNLTLSHVTQRNFRGMTLECKPSRFIEEAGTTLQHTDLSETTQGTFHGSKSFAGRRVHSQDVRSHHASKGVNSSWLE